MNNETKTEVNGRRGSGRAVVNIILARRARFNLEHSERRALPFKRDFGARARRNAT